MMNQYRLFFLLIIIILSPIFIYSQFKETTYGNDYSKSIIYGNVKNATINVYSAKKERKRIVKGKKLYESRKYYYDNKRVFKVEHFEKNRKKLKLKRTLLYDSKENFIKQIWNIEDTSNNLNHQYFYNNLDNLVRITYNRGEFCFGKRSFTYEDDAEIVYEESRRYKENGDSSVTHIFYNYSESDLLNGKIYYKDSEKHPSTYEDWMFNSNELLEKSIYKNGSKEIRTTVFYNYDENNNIISERVVRKNNETNLEFEYTYDNNRNWTSQIRFRNNIPDKFIERILEYENDGQQSAERQ